ncbi:MAG TPA: hypothetical protein PLM07_10710 [Candidatus Rifleibacterium sp.]|nr:hypothetical protein [Candidatus Rifleibacterium sp.]HPT46362.1 hypothetical protein [Candidatus Rifleibacterium sp.]
MKSNLKILLFLLILTQSTILGAAESITHDGLRFSMVPDIDNRSFFGYCYIRVIVANSSPRARQIRFFMRADYARDLQQVSRSFTIQPQETREESLLFPKSDFSTPGLQVEVDGYSLEQTLWQYYRSYRDYYGKTQALVDSKISKNEFDLTFGATGAYGAKGLELNHFDGSLAQLFHNWLGFSQFNILVFRSETIDKMPAPVKQAIFDYIRAGGVLMVIGQTLMPADFTRVSDDDAATFFDGGFGRVLLLKNDILKLPEQTEERPEAPDNSIESLAPGKHSAHRPSVIGGTITPEIEICSLFSDTSIKMRSPFPFEASELETLSARWLMVVIYLFALLIGPVNVFVLYRMGRRILVFLTVPVASLICCGFIYSYYLVFESSTLLVKRQTLTLLDERESRAVSLCNYGIFSARSRPEGLHFSMQTEVYHMSRDDYRSNDAGKYIVLDEDQHLADGWIKPKIPRYLHLRSVETRRERVTLSMRDGRLQLMNGLGADIDKLFIKTRAGKIYSLKNLAAGNTAELKPEPSMQSTEIISSPATIFNEHWFGKISDLTALPEEYLRPGTYVASLKQSPFLRQAIESEAVVSEEAAIIGILREEPGS